MNIIAYIAEHIGQLLTFAGVVVSALISLRNRHKIQEIHLIMNGRLDELLKSVAAKNRLEGAANERQRADDAKPPSAPDR